ncbi:MAG: energy transducer TonB [Sulfuricella sp.]
MNTALSMAYTPNLGRMPELEVQIPSRLGSAFVFALLLEIAIIMGITILAANRSSPISAAEMAPVQVQLVQMPKPVEPPKPKVLLPPPPKPIIHRVPVPLPMPKPAPLPPSPVAAPKPPPSPPVWQVVQAPVEQPATPPPPVPSASEKASYLSTVRSAIQSAVQFPNQARLLNRQGKVQVRFLLKDGVVSELRIITPGSLDVFNKNAVAAVLNAHIQLPSKDMAGKTMDLTLWVLFKLDEN